MRTLITAIMFALSLPALGAVGDENEASDPAPARRGSSLPSRLFDLSPRQAVREGNRLLIEGDSAAALEAYQLAEQLEPDAREIAFVKGLAHYELGEFDKAREAFQKAGALADDSLANDASYSSGTCDHLQALQSTDNPELALSLLESAMRRYHDVLAKEPNHEAARDANLKAATMWRRLKGQLQRRQQQQQDSGEEQQECDQEREDRQQRRRESPQQDNQQQQPQQHDEQQQESKLDRQERLSREQAERRLREMMQAVRARKKARREEVQKFPASPVDKDW